MIATHCPITRDEIERATSALADDAARIVDLGTATEGTLMLNVMLRAGREVTVETAIRAAYHHGLRIGIQIAADRQRTEGPIQ